MSAVRSGYGRLSGLALAAIRHSEGRIFLHPAPSINKIQVATLKATYGEKYPYEEPFPYEKKKFGLFHVYFEKTKPRLNENSKIIVVEGNVAVGKSEFAKRLAKGFDMKYVPATREEACFTDNDYGYDVRKLDSMLPPGARSYDLATFYSDKHPEKGTAAQLQLTWFERKFFDYAKSLLHVLSTGQGVVLDRSVYSDLVFVEALLRMGWVTPNFVKYYYDYRDNSICELLKPHLTIYLDAPIKTIRDRINKRNDPKEINSRVLSGEYLKTIADVYQDKYLPLMRRSGEVVEIDWSEVANNMDMDVIIEELQLVNLESEDKDDSKFEDWSRNNEDDYKDLRQYLANEQMLQGLFNRGLPWEAPEAMLSQDDGIALQRVMNMHPMFKYEKGWAPELGHSTILKF